MHNALEANKHHLYHREPHLDFGLETASEKCCQVAYG